jgi:hypothetical protein
LAARLSQAITVASTSRVAVLTGPAALPIEDEFRHWPWPDPAAALGGDRRLALLQQRQILGMELHQKIARGLRCRQVVPQQQRQRLVVAELIEILGPLTTAAHIVSRLSTISEVLSLRLRLFSLISRSITAAVPV